MDAYARQLGTEQARVEAIRWKLDAINATTSIAAGAKPLESLLDMLTLATLWRMTLESYWVHTDGGAAYQPALVSAKALEQDAWKLAKDILKPEQQDELRDALSRWHSAHLDVRNPLFVRLQDFQISGREIDSSKRSGASSVFDLLALDPAAGLDPAVKEVTKSRLFGERAIFTLQRMPLIVSWQTELLAAQLAALPALQQTLKDTTRIADSADRASRVAEQLPDRLSAERKEILNALDAQESKLQGLASEVKASIDSAEKLSDSLRETIKTFDALMVRFGVGVSNSSAATDTNSQPFNILDYGKTAEQISGTFRELETVLKEFNNTLDSAAWNQRMQDAEKFSTSARTHAASLLNHAFLLAAGLVILVFACALVYRRLARKAGADG